jgi:hypothetical protein
MGMFHCDGCWDNPCTCGKGFEHFTEEKLRAEIAMLEGVLKRRFGSKQEVPTTSSECTILNSPTGFTIKQMKDLLRHAPEVDADGKEFLVLIRGGGEDEFTLPINDIVLEGTERKLVDGTFGYQVILHE